MNEPKLAKKGGTPVRSQPMPPRVAFGDDEYAMVLEVADYYRSRDLDPPYQGVFEERYCGAFNDYMGGGFSDAVSTGTAACYVAIQALDLPLGSHVLISPVTDSGPLNALINLGFVPVLMDSREGSYNIDVENMISRITPQTSAVFAVHAAGEPLEINRIVQEARTRGIKVIEDCSQAPGARCQNQPIGTFGDVAAFSTMYRKTLAAGGSGGLVYTRDENVYRRVLECADRAKPVWNRNVNLSDPSLAEYPALNFNSNEFSCAIGLASLLRMQDAIDCRVKFLADFLKALPAYSKLCRPYAFSEAFSPFYFPIFVDHKKLRCSKTEFAEALVEEGIPNNTHYNCLISIWHYASRYMYDEFVASNAMAVRENSFNLFLNENYGDREVRDIVAAIKKLETHYALDS